MKPFLLLTTGRAGSTALMEALAAHADIAVPAKQIESPDNELLHPKFIQRYAEYYSRACSMPVRNEIDLIDAFFRANAGSSYAGFKSMPSRHRNFGILSRSPQLQLITLRRRDIASTVASFISAADANTWRREGGPQEYAFTFGPQFEKRVEGHLNYIVSSWKRLQHLPGAIHLEYEDLCQPGFSDDGLDAFFGCEIRLKSPKPPTNAEHYVFNWEEFKAFIDLRLKALGLR